MKEENEGYISSYKSSFWIKDPSRELYFYSPSKETKNESMIPKFNKYDAISMYATSGAQRRQVHELFEKLGGNVSIRTQSRDQKKDQWEYHLYIDTVRSASGPQLRAASNTVDFTHKLKFHSFEWWMDKLNGKKYFDSSYSSPTDTHLDKQIEFLNKKNEKVK
jgi:hypothetical protein